MFCPSCGKETPENSTFCLHCGARIASPIATNSQQPVEWEYQDFLYKWSHKKWFVDASMRWTEATARHEIWANYQREITLELQKWLDDGWQPVGEVGPAAIVTTRFSEWFSDYIEPTVFRVTMRRPAIPGKITKKKTAFDVVLVSFGAQKIPVIKALREFYKRELRRDLGLKDAKDLVETPNAALLESVSGSLAQKAKSSLESVGATVQIM